ncbi:lipoate--protein ligase [Aerococcus sp. 1KP-2016]|uniref:lipoate--protein ligase n=1 Tax=Aerococcus sp. 1KP-2016 TaxID=1981982 RepID=UPI000B99C5F5|nr:lipoate--protein ligase [Aerococcus sp. 1KP-2016]OYQ67445.1 lipoate--protein ligase [Aerococcus sp. 1KP-2016]
MYYLKNERNGEEIYDPTYNLAIEYFLVNEKKLDEPILLFYINEPSIIIGKNQNTHVEINEEYVKEHNVHVVRRFSGGGAVYHDLGNICYCFITNDDGNSFRDFKKFTDPIIDSLHKMGVEGAELKGRNDLVIGDQKFSGNAMYATNGRMTSHGTLMFDVDIDETTKVLKPKAAKLKAKGVKSIRRRVTNIKPHMDDASQNMTLHEFRTALLLNIFDVENLDEIKEYQLTDQDWEFIDDFRSRYTNNDDWNYGENPDYEIIRDERTAAGQIEFQFNISKGKIKEAKIYGDFFGLGEISDIEQALIGQEYTRENLLQVFESLNIKNYFGNVTAEELADLASL